MQERDKKNTKKRRKVRRKAEKASDNVNRVKRAQEGGREPSPGLGKVVLGKLEDFPEDFPLETY